MQLDDLKLVSITLFIHKLPSSYYYSNVNEISHTNGSKK